MSKVLLPFILVFGIVSATFSAGTGGKKHYLPENPGKTETPSEKSKETERLRTTDLDNGSTRKNPLGISRQSIFRLPTSDFRLLTSGFRLPPDLGRGDFRLTRPDSIQHLVTPPTPPIDTLPPIKPRYGDFINDSVPNPFDLKDPSAIDKNVEFDPETGQYIITEKIGDEFFRPPTYMTFEEYLEYSRKQQEQAYFRKLAGISTEGGGASALDPIAKFDVKNSLIDRLFGGTTVDIRPQGGIDLTFGVNAQTLDNPILTERQRRPPAVFDFDMNIQMNVTGKIGEKLNLSTNYNTNATFDFDNQIKLNYNSDAFSEDEIIKRIDAGNVSLPLRGSLIQGVQSLFGVITELQFGRLFLTTVVSQQKSQRESIQIKGGGQVQEFEVRADEYDENRHFFLTHYNRSQFEFALENLPQIKSLFKLENIEVWLTNDRNEVDQVRDIVAFADLGEPGNLVNPVAVTAPANPAFPDLYGGALPDNRANNLYSRIIGNPGVRSIDQTVNILTNEFGLQQSRDFEKVSARKLQPSEYTVHPELGYISLNVNVQPNQVVGIAFTYSYNGRTYKVGELSQNSETTQSDSSLSVLFVKMLKSTTQRTDVPTWDLMMKNVYSIGAFQVNREDFKLDVFYDDPGKGQKRFLPESNLQGRPLLRVFNLDRLNVQGDPQPDGVFDFVPGVTINPRNGRIMFPVLEPFGSSLARQIDDQTFRDKYVYQELYDNTLFQAQEFPEKSRFVIRGSYKSSVSNEISLGAFNIPPGSVQVTAGGQILQEGRDYEIDYNIGRVKILNDAILNSGVPINVSFEDNTLFGFQLKSMFGLRADYKIDENFNIGATFLQLLERPFTQKVNIGDDPINNRIYGFDLNLTRPAPWLTKAVDAIPLLSTKQPSSISLAAEAAFLSPGHSRAINQNRKDKGGVVYIDDFEGAASSFDLRQPVNQWFLASVPQNDELNNNPLFPEATLINDVRAGANRARINWYRIDQGVRNQEDTRDPYTSIVPREEVFPNAQIPPDQLPNEQTLDLTFYPQERGPYNFDVPGGYPGISNGVSISGDSMILNDPQTRWGGVMRALNTNDFQSANIEFLEFWMLSPFLDSEDPQNPALNFDEREGDLYINLGNISEDILRDSRKFFENGLPGPFNPNRRVDTTNWSVIPIAQQITRSFDNDPATRELQDVGLDGLDDTAEARKFAGYLDAVRAVNGRVADKLARDPSNDNYRYYRDASFPEEAGIRERYRDFNNPQGNSRAAEGGATRVQSATNIPDAEDLNRDNTLNETESYFQYRIPLRADPLDPREIDQSATPFITDRLEDPRSNRVWYRFRIPLNGPEKVAVGGIRDFRSILFMRMYMRGFRDQTTLRFARLELVRNTWRRYTQQLEENPGECSEPTSFDTDVVNIERNSSRTPFNYVLPEGIQREQALGVFTTLQNEQSVSMIVDDLCDADSRAIFKTINMDWRVYERFKMFVHAEERNALDIQDGDLSVFLRIGSDFKNNYYEYEIPLVMSDSTVLPADPNLSEYKNEVWRPENEFDFPLSLLTDLKTDRNSKGASVGEDYIRVLNPDEPGRSHIIKVRGNPNVGFVKVAMIGIRNRRGGDTRPLSAEVWINEMRLTGLDERGGMASIARVDMQMADFGNLTVAGNYSSIGFGALDQKVQQRQREQITGFDIAANFQLGKFFPENWGLRLPFYTQFSKTIRAPEYDPYDLDIRLKDKIAAAQTAAERDSIRLLAQDVSSVRSFTFTNVGKDRRGNRPPLPWDIENFSISYALSETERRDPIIEFDREKRQTAGLNYAFSITPKYLEPFKSIKGKWLQLISQINFNPLPSNFTFGTVMDRRFNTTRWRFTGLDDRFNTFYNKSFTWDRDYTLQWDLTKALKFTFNATNAGVVDEPDEIKLIEDPNVTDPAKVRRDSIWKNIKKFGRTKNYLHNFQLSYQAPTRLIPLLDWVQLRGQYQGEYSWSAAALNIDSLGNVIQNRQDLQLTADLNFEALYNKWGYLSKINRGRGNAASRRPPAGQPQQGQQGQEAAGRAKSAGDPSIIERALLRPLMLLRRARFNYTERYSTAVPGFTPQARLLGMSSGFSAPGWDFIAGIQPRIRELSAAEYGSRSDWLATAAAKGWITPNVLQNREVVQEYNQVIDARVTLEPFRDFRVDLELNKNYTQNHTEFFKDTLNDGIAAFSHTVPKDLGSMTVSYSALSTLFKDSNDDIRALFQTFETNRVAISRRLGTGLHDDPVLAELGYTKGYGRTQQDVLIPAFIAAYTKQDPNAIKLNIFNTTPRINWRLTYNGLSQLPLFRDLFQSFQVTHGYKASLTINSFQTGLDWLRTSFEPGGPINELNSNFYPRLEIPQIGITEAFSPLLAVQATLKNGLSLSVDYKKARQLGMSFISNQLSETRTKEFVITMGWRLRNVNLPFLGGRANRGRGGRNQPAAPGGTQAPPAAGGQLQGRDLDINFNFSMRDDVTFNHLLDQGVIEPTRGNYALSISPAAEYQLNRNLALRFFVDYRRTEPKTSAGFPRTDTAGGVVVRFKLN